MTPATLLLPLSLFLSLALACACNPSSVDETGYLQPPDIDTTSEEPLDEEEPRRVVVVGNPGAVAVSGGLLKVTISSGASSSLLVEDPGGSFVTTIEATALDTLVLFYDKDGEDEIEIDLSGTGTLVGPRCGTCNVSSFFSAPDASGNTRIDLSVLDDPSPPYTLFNEDRAIAVLAETVGVAEIAADSGDRVCVYQRGDAGTSAPLCELVP